MILYYAGLRMCERKHLGRIPPRVLFTFADLTPHGGKLQRKLFKELLAQRRKGGK